MNQVKPNIKCVAFIDENDMIKGAYIMNKMEISTLGLLILEIENLLNKLKEKYRSGGIVSEKNV